MKQQGVTYITLTLLIFTSSLSWSQQDQNFRLRWNENIGSTMFYQVPLLTESLAIIGNDEGKILALNIQNGKTVWTFEANGPIYNTPVLHNNILYFASRNGKFYAISSKNGHEKWTYDIDDRLNCNPVIYGQHIILHSRSNIYALDLNTGLDYWTKPFSISGSPKLVLKNDVIYFTNDMKVDAIKANDGSPVWEYKLATYGASNVEVGTEYVLVQNGKILYFVNIKDGVCNYFIDFESETKQKHQNAPLFNEGKVYASNDNILRAIMSKEGLIWKYKSKTGDELSEVTFYEGRLYFTDRENNIISILEDKGKKPLVYSHNCKIKSSKLVIANQHIYFIDEEGKLNSLRIM